MQQPTSISPPSILLLLLICCTSNTAASLFPSSRTSSKAAPPLRHGQSLPLSLRKSNVLPLRTLTVTGAVTPAWTSLAASTTVQCVQQHHCAFSYVINELLLNSISKRQPRTHRLPSVNFTRPNTQYPYQHSKKLKTRGTFVQMKTSSTTADEAEIAGKTSTGALAPLGETEIAMIGNIVMDEIQASSSLSQPLSLAADAGKSAEETIQLAQDVEVNAEDLKNNPAYSALQRAVEIGTILVSDVVAPILISLTNQWPTDWEAFWSISTPSLTSGGTTERAESRLTHAQRLSLALEKLGPTYVKFGQALGSRPDVIPASLAKALRVLQDDMASFDGELARNIIWKELSSRVNETDKSNLNYGIDQGTKVTTEKLQALLSSLATESEPVAAASIGQVYKANLPGVGDVAVKVQRPGVRLLVERDLELLLTVATFLESLPALPSQKNENQPATSNRLINTQLVSATKEFMSRIFEELDYRNEAANCIKFANLYSRHNGTSKDVSVVVPKVYSDWCTENVLVMEWIDGTKLTDVQQTAAQSDGGIKNEMANHAQKSDEALLKENLELVKVAIDSTLSQLLVTGVLHADPHAGNLLKITLEDGTVTLGYLDFGLISEIPMQVRDALVCAVALQVFSRDVNAVASLFGELQLIPQLVLEDEFERLALVEALEITFENSLRYPTSPDFTSSGEGTTIPELKFDKLLDSLSRLVPRFQFDLPPYFINNARALSTLEGIAKSLDPTFNVLTIMYPYALNRLLKNPSKSPVVEDTLQSLIRSSDGRIDQHKIVRLLRDSALISGVSKRRVMWDVMKTREGRSLAWSILREELMHAAERRNKKKRKNRYFLEL